MILLAYPCQQYQDDFGIIEYQNTVPNNLFIQRPWSFAVNPNKAEVAIPFNQKSLLVYNYETNKITQEYKIDTAMYKEVYSKCKRMYPNREFLAPFDPKRSKYSTGLTKSGEVYFSEETNTYEFFSLIFFPYQKNVDTALVNVNGYNAALLTLNEDISPITFSVKDTFDYVGNFTPEFPFYKKDSILYVSELSFVQQNYDSIKLPLLAKYIVDADNIIKYKNDIEIFYDGEIHEEGKLTILTKRAFDLYKDEVYFTEGNYIYNLISLEKLTPDLKGYRIASFMLTELAIYTVLYSKADEKSKLVMWDITMQQKLKEKDLTYSKYALYNFANQNLYSIDFNKNKEVIFKSYHL